MREYGIETRPPLQPLLVPSTVCEDLNESALGNRMRQERNFSAAAE